MMEVLYRCCCGLDVHKKSITAGVLWAEGKGRRKEKRTFGTFTRDLLSLLDWLKQCGVTHVAMQSTGVYWKPVWNILEGQLEQVLLLNAQHSQAVPGLTRRTVSGLRICCNTGCCAAASCRGDRPVSYGI